MNGRIATMLILTLTVSLLGTVYATSPVGDVGLTRYGFPPATTYPSEAPENNNIYQPSIAVSQPPGAPPIGETPTIIPEASFIASKPREASMQTLDYSHGNISLYPADSAQGELSPYPVTTTFGYIKPHFLSIEIWDGNKWTKNPTAFCICTWSWIKLEVPEDQYVWIWDNGNWIQLGFLKQGIYILRYHIEAPSGWQSVAAWGSRTGNGNFLWIYATEGSLQFDIIPPGFVQAGKAAISYQVDKACQAEFSVVKPGGSLGIFKANAPGPGMWQFEYPDQGPAGKRFVVGIAWTACDCAGDREEFQVL